jgi:hypothetical protein
VSEINLGLYRTFLQPWVRSWANEGFAKWARQFHPLRLQYEMFSATNPFMRPLLSFVENVRKSRQPVPQENAFWQAQEQLSHWIETSLDAYRDLRDHMSEALFHTVYGSPIVQAMVGLKASDASAHRRPGADAAHRALVAQRVDELRGGIAEGGPREAVLRALLYIRIPEGAVDERSFNFLRRMRADAGEGLTLAAFKKLVREQFLMLLLDERRAVEAIPAMLATDPDLASHMTSNLHRIIGVVGLRTNQAKARLEEIEELIENGGHSERLRTTDRETREPDIARPRRPHNVTRTKHH